MDSHLLRGKGLALKALSAEKMMVYLSHPNLFNWGQGRARIPILHNIICLEIIQDINVKTKVGSDFCTFSDFSLFIGAAVLLVC